MRRRASLYTQYAVAAQKTTPKKMARFRITYHVADWKKSSNRAAIGMWLVTGGSSRRYSPRRTSGPRRPRAGRTRRRRRLRLRGVCGAVPSAHPPREVGQQVQRARDENGALGACELARA